MVVTVKIIKLLIHLQEGRSQKIQRWLNKAWRRRVVTSNPCMVVTAFRAPLSMQPSIRPYLNLTQLLQVEALGSNPGPRTKATNSPCFLGSYLLCEFFRDVKIRYDSALFVRIPSPVGKPLREARICLSIFLWGVVHPEVFP